MTSFTVSDLSHPKINALLSVVGKNEHNYHILETLFLLLDSPCDQIKIDFTPSSLFEYTLTSNADIPLDHRNLCTKALLAYFKEKPITGHFSIDIQKYIPIAGGMGGGSSNAATVFLLLNQIYHYYTVEQLHAIAAKLGADIPLFLYKKSAVGRNIGDELTFIDTSSSPDWGVVLVDSSFPVPASWAYQHRKGDYSSIGHVKAMLDAFYAHDFERFLSLIHNDLADAVIEKFPLLQLHIKMLKSLGAQKIVLSGSGPTLFTFLPTFELAHKLATEFNALSDDQSYAIASKILKS